MEEQLWQRKLQWFGHVWRMPAHCPQRQVLRCRSIGRKRPPGGTPLRWCDLLNDDLKGMRNWSKAIKDRAEWQTTIHANQPRSVPFRATTPRSCATSRVDMENEGGKVRVCVCVQCQDGAQAFTTKQEKRHQERHGLRHHLPTASDSHRCQTCSHSFLSSAGYKNHRCVKKAQPTVLGRDAFHYSCLQSENIQAPPRLE